tara:strand:- start:108 stop:662 length:555 start_codon:yes stop_codon:yes gene_type:complete
MKSSIKPFIEFGPVVVFFIYFYKTGKIQDAILPLMIAAAVAIVLSFIIDRKVSPMLLFSTILIFIFGFLSLKFNSPTFIQLKVTIVNLIFSIILFLGFFLKRPFLKSLMGSNLKMSDESWLEFGKRWAIFFLFLAVCNEVIRLIFTEEKGLEWVWVNFKLFGIMGLTFLFIFSQVFFIQKNTEQ